MWRLRSALLCFEAAGRKMIAGCRFSLRALPGCGAFIAPLTIAPAAGWQKANDST